MVIYDTVVAWKTSLKNRTNSSLVECCKPTSSCTKGHFSSQCTHSSLRMEQWRVAAEAFRKISVWRLGAGMCPPHGRGQSSVWRALQAVQPSAGLKIKNHQKPESWSGLSNIITWIADNTCHLITIFSHCHVFIPILIKISKPASAHINQWPCLFLVMVEVCPPHRCHSAIQNGTGRNLGSCICLGKLFSDYKSP